MARLYDTSSDYQEHITYGGDAAAVDYDNPQYSYDRELAGYDGDTQDLDQGYASTSITYSSGGTVYNGTRIFEVTGSGAGLGSSSANGVRVALRVASG